MNELTTGTPRMPGGGFFRFGPTSRRRGGRRAVLDRIGHHRVTRESEALLLMLTGPGDQGLFEAELNRLRLTHLGKQRQDLLVEVFFSHADAGVVLLRVLQLVERGSLLTRQARQLFGSLANLARRLAESIRNVAIAADAIDPAHAPKIQIRLETS